MAKISIIIPVYNGEKTIRRSVDSVINQTFKDLEIIIIDDGSTDSSGAICDEYAAKDSRVKVIHQKNSGPAEARNNGIALATSPLIGFVDCDDYATPIMYEVLYNLMKNTDSDMTCCNVEVFDKKGTKKYFNKDFCNCAVWEGKDIFHHHVAGENMFISTAVWDKLIKKDIVTSHLFKKGEMFEDLRLISFWLTKCNRVAYTGQPMYHYFESAKSLTRGTHFNRHWLEWFGANEERIKIYKEYDPDDLKYIYATYVDNALSIMYKGRHHNDFKTVRKAIRTKMYAVVKENPNLPMSKKCRHKYKLFRFSRHLYYISMDLYEVLRKIIHK